MASRAAGSGTCEYDETALSLVTRLTVRPVRTGLAFLDRELGKTSHGGLVPGQALQMVGRSLSGKTEMLYQMALSAVLPRKFDGLRFGGQDVSILLIDLDLRFSCQRLQDLLAYRVAEAMRDREISGAGSLVGPAATATAQFLDSAKYAQLRDIVMERIVVADCGTGSELLEAISQAGKVVDAQAELGRAVGSPPAPLRFIFVDNITAVYWQEDARAPTVKNVFYDKLAAALRGVMHKHDLVAVLTSGVIFRKQALGIEQKLSCDLMLGGKWASFITHKVVLRENHPRPFFAGTPSNPSSMWPSTRCEYVGRFVGSSSMFRYRIMKRGVTMDARQGGVEEAEVEEAVVEEAAASSVERTAALEKKMPD